MNTSTTTAATTTPLTPWSRPQRRIYEDLILKPEFEERKLQVPIGQTWLRIVPKQEDSILSSWMMPVHALGFKEGKFAHSKSLKANSKSVYDIAYAWLHKNKPQMLFSKQHPTGVRLLTDPVALFWCVVDLGQGPVIRLFQASGYDGTRGGVPGLGFSCWRLATRDPIAPGEYSPDAADFDQGVQICIEKSQPAEAKYPSYRLFRGQMPVPFGPILDLLSPEEKEVLCPVEQTVRELTPEEQWIKLATMIPKEIVEQIKASTK